MSYTKHAWVTGETITAEKLNNIEDGVDDVTRQISDVEENQIPELKNAISQNNPAGITQIMVALLDQVGDRLLFTSDDGGSIWNDIISEMKAEVSGIKKCSILWNGYNYIASNVLPFVRLGKAFSCVVTPSPGFVISDLTVTMGGATITTTVDEGIYTINIPTVTDDVEITVSSSADPMLVLFQRKNVLLDGSEGQNIATGLAGGSNESTAYGDWTMLFTVKSTAPSRSGGRVFSANHHCLRCQDTASTGTAAPFVAFNKGATAFPRLTDYISAVITHKSGDNKTITLYYKNGDHISSETITSDNSAWYIDGSNYGEVYFGGAPDGSNRFIGEIKDYEIFSTVFNNSSITDYIMNGGGTV